MSWIADADVAGLALWAALILTGIVAGTFAGRWKHPDLHDRRSEGLLLAAAAASVIAWFANAGGLVGGPASNRLLAAHVPIVVDTGFRLAVLWATLPGAALTLATALLVRAVLAARPQPGPYGRRVAALVIMALVALGVASWFAPPPNDQATGIPPFVQSAAAALAPLFALAALAVLADLAAVRIGGASPAPLVLLAAWGTATLAVAAEQLARSRLGIGPRDAVVLGNASSGLVLWLITSALLHRRVQAMVFGAGASPAVRSPVARAGSAAGHVGALLLVVSFGAHALARRATISIPPGGSVSLPDAFRRTWHLAHQGLSRFDAEGVDVVSLALEVRPPSGATALLTSEIREYHGRTGEHLENTVSLRSSTGSPTQAMRVLLVDADSLDVASVRITFLPLPILWPAGLVLLGMSALAGLDRRPATIPSNE